jgi:hypothetical protein
MHSLSRDYGVGMHVHGRRLLSTFVTLVKVVTIPRRNIIHVAFVWHVISGCAMHNQRSHAQQESANETHFNNPTTTMFSH